MDAAPDKRVADVVSWLLEQWREKLSVVFRSMADLEPQVILGSAWVTSDELNPMPLFWQELPLSLTPDSAILVAAPESTWLKLGDVALRAVGLEQVDMADARNTYLEILSQTTSSAVQNLGSRMDCEINLLASKERSMAPAGLHFARLELSAGDLNGAPLFWGVSAGLENALRGPQPSSSQGAVDSASPNSGTQRLPEASNTRMALPSDSKTLELLLEVELPVSVSFGRARLPLRDVLKLTSGSIVELNRTVSEPVELIINGAVIARGEVVVVEGNYGVRIDRIISRQERLRTVR